MRVVIQRCKSASILVNNELRTIDKGLVILLGIGVGDNKSDIEYLVNKIINLRIFEDNDNKMNYSVKDINGSILLVSQFTLYADTKKGNRPSFNNSMEFESAKELYELFISKISPLIDTKTGEFGEHMEVSLINDGPVTIIIDTKENKNEKE